MLNRSYSRLMRYIPLLGCLATAHAEKIIWFYDLTEQPPDWIVQSEWSFGSTGMKCSFGFGWGNGIGGCAYSDTIPIPAGTDSLRLLVHNLYVGQTNNTNVGAHIDIGSDESGWAYIWEQSGDLVDSTLISVSIAEIPSGTQCRLRFVGWGSLGGGSSGTGSLEWTLRNLVLAAYLPSEAPGFEWSTWGLLKSLF